MAIRHGGAWRQSAAWVERERTAKAPFVGLEDEEGRAGKTIGAPAHPRGADAGHPRHLSWCIPSAAFVSPSSLEVGCGPVQCTASSHGTSAGEALVALASPFIAVALLAACWGRCGVSVFSFVTLYLTHNVSRYSTRPPHSPCRGKKVVVGFVLILLLESRPTSASTFESLAHAC